MKEINKQIIRIYLDDSGKISEYEDYAVYSGLVFIEKEKLNAFTNKYKTIRNELWKKNEYKNYDELKGNNLKHKDRLRLLKLMKNEFKITLVIKNKFIRKKEILTNTSSKGRFKDYALKRLIKDTFKYLISEKLVDPNEPVVLVLNIDQETTKSNGYYSLTEGIYEEIKMGINNFNYGLSFKPILFSEFEVVRHSHNSKENIAIQSADILSNDIRRCLNNKLSLFADLVLYLPH